jgi:hypothetical protein
MNDTSSDKKQAERALDVAKAEIKARHAFYFKLEGRRCRCVYKYGGGFTITDVPEWLYSDLENLCDEIRRFENRAKLLLLKKRDVQTFLYKLFRGKTKIYKAMRHVSVSAPPAD